MTATPFLARDFTVPAGKVHTRDYLAAIGVPDIAPATCPFDPGYDPLTFEGHLAQSSQLMETMKISMACWQVCDEDVTRWKVAACAALRRPDGHRRRAVRDRRPAGPAAALSRPRRRHRVTRIEAGEGFTDMPLPPNQVIAHGRRAGPGGAVRARQEA